MPDDPLPFERDLTALQAHVAAHGVDEAAVKLANALDERFVVALGLDAFAHALVALCGQQLGKAGATAEEILHPGGQWIHVGPQVQRRHLEAGQHLDLLMHLRRRGRTQAENKTDAARMRQYLAFLATWWRP